MADFDDWSQESLARLAEDLMDENTQLTEDIAILRNAWRELVKEKYLAGVPAGSLAPLSPFPEPTQELAKPYADRR